MKKIALLLVVSMASFLYGAEDITGIWKSIDDTTGLVKSISVIYEYQGEVYGRILVTYEDNGDLADVAGNGGFKAEKLVGDPYFAGLDFIYNMKERGKKWSAGKILDPQPGKVYDCTMWKEDGKLIVRGSILFFGRNQTWIPLTDKSELPANLVMPKNLVPKIPKVK